MPHNTAHHIASAVAHVRVRDMLGDKDRVGVLVFTVDWLRDAVGDLELRRKQQVWKCSGEEWGTAHAGDNMIDKRRTRSHCNKTQAHTLARGSLTTALARAPPHEDHEPTPTKAHPAPPH